MENSKKILLPFKLYEELENLDKLNPDEMKSFLLNLRRYCDSTGKDYGKICKELDLEIPSWAGKLTPKQVRAIEEALTPNKYSDDKMGEYTVNSDGIVDIIGNFRAGQEFFSSKSLLGIKFGKVEGQFNISNIGLDSLEGCPEEVTMSFVCERNNMETLEGGPSVVGGDYRCDYSKRLTSLKGSPEVVGGNFNASDCALVTLEGGPKIVKGSSFDVSFNPIKTLKGAPEKIGTGSSYSPHFYARNCYQLSSLEGASELEPNSRGEYYNFENCPALYSLEGIPLDAKPTRIGLEKNGLKPSILRRAFSVAKETKSWIVAYLSMFTDPDFIKTGKAPKDPIREKLSPDNIKKEIEQNGEKFVVGIKSIWKDPRVKKILKEIDIPEETKADADLLSDLDDVGL